VIERVEWTPAESIPAREEILRLQGVPAEGPVPAHIDALVDTAIALYRDVTEPRALLRPIDHDAFADVYRGDGRNFPETPLDVIVPKAERLTLFAATIGARASTRIRDLFEARDLALGAMFDSVCSAAADRLAKLLGAREQANMPEGGADACRVLAYSPGYCGWHVSGQRALFGWLRPEAIGITLNPSCLMQPLKSVSGVLVAGPASIHKFHPRFPFCEECPETPCRVRMAIVPQP
jgi:hypothetical protein